MDKDFSQMRVQKVPPGTSPKPYTQASQAFKLGNYLYVHQYLMFFTNIHLITT